VGDVGVVASSGDAVGPEVVGGDLVVEGVVFGLVVKHVGFEVEVEAVGGSGDGDVAAFGAGASCEVFGGLSAGRSGKVASCFLLPTM
jgi:hypothetical protein